MRVVVAMSGGVDSSVAALRLRDAGHEVLGVFLRNGVEAPGGTERPHQGCCGATDARDAEEVAAVLGIPFYALDQAPAFARIVEDFVAAYAAGRTPNPCVLCNRDLKFGELLRFATALGADAVATGHYARVAAAGGGVELRRAVDRKKDQSYVLARVPRSALRRSLFPVGGLYKEEVREQARRAGLPVHHKPDSQELCFVPSGDYRDLLRERRPDLFAPGPIRGEAGEVLGAHGGTAAFTVGQRHGLRLGGGGPWYVRALDPGNATVHVARKAGLLTRRTLLLDVNWLGPGIPAGVAVAGGLQLRAHHAPHPAEFRERAENDGIEAVLEDPGDVVVPGQTGAWYDGDRVVAAGVLATAKAEARASSGGLVKVAGPDDR